MIATIKDALLDVLQADSRLCTGFSGVKRISSGDQPAFGYVNLFSYPYRLEKLSSRPAVYIGSTESDLIDTEDIIVASDNMLEYRLLSLPLVIAVSDKDVNEALKDRDRLLSNLHTVLMDNRVNTYWWLLNVVNVVGRVAPTQGGSVGTNEVWGRIGCAIRYIRPTNTTLP